MKEYKTRQNWMGKVIHWELCKKVKFNHTNKWYVHNPESVLENETDKLLWNYEIQTDLQTTRPNNNLQKRKNSRICKLCCLGGE